jgi:hypothetical protein
MVGELWQLGRGAINGLAHTFKLGLSKGQRFTAAFA